MTRWYEFSIVGFFSHYVLLFIIVGVLPDLNSTLYWNTIVGAVALFWFAFFVKAAVRLTFSSLFAVYLSVSLAAPLAAVLFKSMLAISGRAIDGPYILYTIYRIGGFCLVYYGIFLVLILSGRWVWSRFRSKARLSPSLSAL